MGTRKSSDQHQFAMVPGVSMQRSRFNRSSGLKTTFQAGQLIPIFVDEALPGDTFSLKPTLFGRLATPIHPVMENLWMETFFFSVPLRLIWDNFQKFMGEQENPGDSTDYLVPQVVAADPGGFGEETIHDYFGLPTKVPALSVSAFWHRAYALVWNEWFRDENLQDSILVNKDDGPDDPDDVVIQRRGKRHDYFTSCLPFAQKGVDVTLPLGASAPVIGAGGTGPTFDVSNLTDVGIYGVGADARLFWPSAPSGSAQASWNDPDLEADLSSATAATINSIREAFQLQRLLERDARGGTRYTEILRSHFSVVSPDQRLQRPEFLGGGRTRVQLHQVAQTSEAGTTPLAELAAFGIATGTDGSWTKSFVEHCVVIGMVCVRADLNYQQGLDRMFSRSTRYDYYWPSLANLGEQAVLNKELYAQGSADPTADDEVFGYQERYAEYRYKPSKITGQMRSNHSTPLDAWHLAQDFSTLPVLNDEFIVEDPPVDRIIAVTGAPHMLLDAYFDLHCARPMPMYSVPGLIDHF